MPMNARLLRPTASGIHPDAMEWRTRVLANGGTVDGVTMSAVSQFCRRIDAGGLRDRFYRLNLFCGDGLPAALVPLYRAESRTATARGNATDTNNGPFVSDDYNNTGSSSGLKGNGTSKFLNTGILANSLTANNTHLGFGLRATQTGSAAFRALAGAFNNSTNSFEVSVRRNDAVRGCIFTRFGTAGDTFGEQVQTSSLAVGDIVAAWPTFYRNGSASGTGATSSQNYPSAHAVHIFALNNGGTSSTINYTDARMNWYSIGLTMTAAQVLSFYNAIAAFNTALSRT
jgi:hypothetical protein